MAAPTKSQLATARDFLARAGRRIDGAAKAARPCGHIHHARYVRNGHTAEGCPPAPYAQASGRVHTGSGEF